MTWSMRDGGASAVALAAGCLAGDGEGPVDVVSAQRDNAADSRLGGFDDKGDALG